MGDRLLSIGEVAAASGLRASALRYYEDVGLITPSAREGGRRHYHPSVLRRLAIIALCQDVGFTISEIADFMKPAPRARARWRSLAQKKLTEVEAQIERARATKHLLEQVLSCGCGDPAGCELVDESRDRRLIQIAPAGTQRE